MSTETAEMRIYPVPTAGPRPPVDLPDRSVRAIVIDAHAPTRIGTAVLLRNQTWVSRCFLAANVDESLRLVASYRPDIAVLDVSETGPFAGAVTARIRDAHPGVEIVLSSRCKTSLGTPLADLGAVADRDGHPRGRQTEFDATLYTHQVPGGMVSNLRHQLGRSILLGLELLVAADIIRTVAVTPTLESVGVLAGIVVIRTFLSFSLELEISGRWPWQQTPPQQSS